MKIAGAYANLRRYPEVLTKVIVGSHALRVWMRFEFPRALGNLNSERAYFGAVLDLWPEVFACTSRMSEIRIDATLSIE